ncbi:MAG: response regulator [Nitrospinota bacterium]
MDIKLLIVDDEEEILSTLNRFFTLHDFDITTTNSAAEALKIMEKDKINIALMDINMLEMDGIELLSRI